MVMNKLLSAQYTNIFRNAHHHHLKVKYIDRYLPINLVHHITTNPINAQTLGPDRRASFTAVFVTKQDRSSSVVLNLARSAA